MALPTEYERRKQTVFDTLTDAPAKYVADVLKATPKIRKIYGMSRKEYRQLIDDLKNPKSEFHQESRDFIAQNTTTKRLQKLNAAKINLPTIHERDVAHAEGKEHLGAKIEKTRENLLNWRIHKFLLKDIAEIYALATSRMKMTRGERQALLATISAPTLMPYAFAAFTGIFTLLAPTSQVEASSPTPPQSDTAHSQTIRKPLTRNTLATGNVEKDQKTNKFFNLSSLPNIPIPEQRPTLSDDAKYEPLLSLIRTKEANGNCNVAFGGKSYNLTSMSINSIRDFQDKLIAEGKPSSAMGCYQIIRSTMDFSSKLLGYTGEEIFTEETQKQMAIALLRHRGADEYLAGEMKLGTFVANLAKEWASFPKDKKGKSHYAGDGLNKALVSYERVVSAIDMSKRISMTIDGSLDPITTASVAKQNPS